jgi:hypothetical protein
MSFFNEEFRPIIERAIEKLRQDGATEFTTVALIQKQWGSYHSDSCNVDESINANIGKFLGENAAVFGIKEKRAHQSVEDDCGNPTTCSLWEFVN